MREYFNLFFSFTGTITRREYILEIALILALQYLAAPTDLLQNLEQQMMAILQGKGEPEEIKNILYRSIWYSIPSLILIFSLFALVTKRLRSADYSTAWRWLMILPILNTILIILLCFAEEKYEYDDDDDDMEEFE